VSRLALAAALALAACAGPRPWKVTPEKERRFRQSVEACELLTDDPGAFETCMKRRGWRHEWPFGL